MRPAIATVPALLLALSLAAQTLGSHPNVTVRTFEIAGAPELSAQTRQEIVADIVSRRYKSPDFSREISMRVYDALQRRGYFKARVEDPYITVVRQAPTGEVVDAELTAEPGAQYRLKDILIAGAKAFPANELRRQIPLNPGDLFDVEQVRGGIKGLRDLYCAKGYLDMTPVPNTEIDDAQHLITLTFDIDEGTRYRSGQLKVQGDESEPGARTRLLTAWKAYEGKPYDPGVLERFLRDVHARPDLRPDQIFRISQDQRTHMVNVEITLAKLVR